MRRPLSTKAFGLTLSSMFNLGLMIVFATASVGCGTIQNVRRECHPETKCPAVYGGTKQDLALGMDVLMDTSCGHAGLPGCVIQKVFVAPYLLTVDLALSAIADTFTLPLMIGIARDQKEVRNETE